MGSAAYQALEQQLALLRSIDAAIADGRLGETNRTKALELSIASGLRIAQPFYWNAQTLAAVVGAGGAFDLDAINATRALCYSDAAFCWLGDRHRDLMIETREGLYPITAVLWHWSVFKRFRPERPERNHFVEGLAVYTFTRFDDDATDMALTRDLAVGMCVGIRANDPLSHTLKDPPLPRPDELLLAEQWRRNGTKLVQFVVAANTFLRQRLIGVTMEGPDRHARRRLARDAWTGEQLVRVVQLRARDYQHGVAGPAGPVKWSCQWVVRGHVRQQYYPSLGANLPIYVDPYLKGPDDKPLKPSATSIMAVVR